MSVAAWTLQITLIFLLSLILFLFHSFRGYTYIIKNSIVFSFEKKLTAYLNRLQVACPYTAAIFSVPSV